jgi:CheY-like chemotaxis protein
MGQTTNRRILLVEDDADTCEVIAMLLHEKGYDVSTAANGLDALLQLKTGIPDLVISDLNMPQMSGFELLSILHCSLPSIPAIAMSTAYGFRDRLPEGVKADAFFPKGRCRLEELFQTAERLIQASVVRQQSADTMEFGSKCHAVQASTGECLS